ncbi:MAG: LysM peptidoglycan-binding domain-containing protein [Kiritimatiellaceae bacterium]|nr:LysM peptidoglycan-binding domain-containing protein [Kiritimatiellaceae bacterium]
MKKLLLTLTCIGLITGCGPQTGEKLDSADEADPRVRVGLERVDQKNWDDAILHFEDALMKNPALGRPDLELALIYHQQKKNYVRAVYHYERYLEKRPETEKQDLILESIQQAKVSLAGEIGLADSKVEEEVVRLTRENNWLRQQLAQAGGASAAQVTTVKTIVNTPPAPRPVPVAQPAVVPAVAQVAAVQPAVAPAVAAPKPNRTYAVRPGDTLSRIAGQMYGDITQWKVIYQANRGVMKSASDIKVGQTLIIPNLEQ